MLIDDYKFITIKLGTYPWGNPQCLAARAYPLVSVRPLLRLTARDADVFPGDPFGAIGAGRPANDERTAGARPSFDDRLSYSGVYI
jgi:hypothetical protein